MPAATAMQVPRPFEFTQVQMGLPVRILLHASDESRGQAAARAAFDRIAVLDRLFGGTGAGNEVRRLEAGGSQWTPVSPDLLEVLTTAVAVARATDGAYDPTVAPLVTIWREARRTGHMPSHAALETARKLVGWRHIEIDRATGMVRLAKEGVRLDLAGIAKGYILDQAVRVMRMKGIGRVLIESGGNVVAGSGPPGLAGWRIQAAGADAAFRQRASELTNASVATSEAGAQFAEIDGTRYSHIIDPRSGLALTNAVTARVIARDAAVADALATALTIAGPSGARAILERFPDVVVSLSLNAK